MMACRKPPVSKKAKKAAAAHGHTLVKAKTRKPRGCATVAKKHHRGLVG
jgi:hypothetical protein